AKALDHRLAVGDRADQHRAVRDRLVARDGQAALNRRRRLDLHSASTGEIDTPYPCASSSAAARSAWPSPATSIVSTPPRSDEKWRSSKSSMLIRSAPRACVIP